MTTLLDVVLESLESLQRHPLRTSVTSLTVAWGIFALTVLLAAGTGLENNAAWQYRDDATNSVWIYRGRTSRPWEGHPVGRQVQFDNDDVDVVRAMPEVGYLTGRFYRWGNTPVRYQEKTASYSVRAVHPDHQHLEKTVVVSGRFLNDLDLQLRRKVVVIGRKVAENLLAGLEPVGASLDVVGLPFQVVGVFVDAGGDGEMEQVYIPISTGQLAFSGGRQVHQIMFSVPSGEPAESARLADEVVGMLARRHHFDPHDSRAVRVRDNTEEYARVTSVFRAIRLFTWAAGLGTLLAGTVGVSNILLVSVQERTAEIGLRKALGARPSHIVAMIVGEAVALTSLSGALGFCAAVLVVTSLSGQIGENDYVRDPEVQVGAALLATLVLTGCGGLAGLFPALRAAAIKPVAALREGER